MTIPRTMKVVQFHGPGDLRLAEVPVPTPAPGEVLVRVERVGLCGSDLEEYVEGPVVMSADSLPLVLGHEVVGRIAQTCDGGPPVGSLVVPDVVVGCGTCWWCTRHQEGLCPNLLVRGQQQDGGLAEYMTAAAATCVAVPDDVSPGVAVLAEPLAVGLRALGKVGDLSGRTVTVWGLGTVGQFVAQLAALRGATVVGVDPSEAARTDAGRVGARAVAPDGARELVLSLTQGRGADLAVECSGVPSAPATCIDVTRPGGDVVLVGFRDHPLELDWLQLVLGERRLIGSAAHLWDVEVAGAVALLGDGRFTTEHIPTVTFPLEAVATAFERLRAGERIKAVINLVGPTEGQ